jgi:hypothetical protein
MSCRREEVGLRQAAWLGALVLVTTQRATHYEGVLVRCSRAQSPRELLVEATGWQEWPPRPSSTPTSSAASRSSPSTTGACVAEEAIARTEPGATMLEVVTSLSHQALG